MLVRPAETARSMSVRYVYVCLAVLLQGQASDLISTKITLDEYCRVNYPSHKAPSHQTQAQLTNAAGR